MAFAIDLSLQLFESIYGLLVLLLALCLRWSEWCGSL